MSEEEIKKILLYLLNASYLNQTILSIQLRLDTTLTKPQLAMYFNEDFIFE